MVQSVSGLRPLWVRPDYRAKALAVGSVLTYARPHDVVVGAGLIRASRTTLPRGVDVKALRGPLTAEYAGVDPDGIVFGDPGLLAAECLGIEVAASPMWDVVVVPHLVDYQSALRLVASVPPSVRLTVVDVRRGPRSVIETIASGRTCVSSSLHGLVVAESLGVPAVWTTITGSLSGGTFKFLDYLTGTGRPEDTSLPFRDAWKRPSVATLRDSSPTRPAFGRRSAVWAQAPETERMAA